MSGAGRTTSLYTTVNLEHPGDRLHENQARMLRLQHLHRAVKGKLAQLDIPDTVYVSQHKIVSYATRAELAEFIEHRISLFIYCLSFKQRPQRLFPTTYRQYQPKPLSSTHNYYYRRQTQFLTLSSLIPRALGGGSVHALLERSV